MLHPPAPASIQTAMCIPCWCTNCTGWMASASERKKGQGLVLAVPHAPTLKFLNLVAISLSWLKLKWLFFCDSTLAVCSAWLGTSTWRNGHRPQPTCRYTINDGATMMKLNTKQKQKSSLRHTYNSATAKKRGKGGGDYLVVYLVHLQLIW